MKSCVKFRYFACTITEFFGDANQFRAERVIPCAFAFNQACDRPADVWLVLFKAPLVGEVNSGVSPGSNNARGKLQLLPGPSPNKGAVLATIREFRLRLFPQKS